MRARVICAAAAALLALGCGKNGDSKKDEPSRCAGVVCTASDPCHDAGVCDPATGTCSNPAKPNGAHCDDGDACTQSDTCQGGVCVGADRVVCTELDQCHDVGLCDPATGTCSNPLRDDGAHCDDGDACTQVDACHAGTCVGSSPVACSGTDQCHDAGTCDAVTGMCSNPAKTNGTACDDGNACTQSDTCVAGQCSGASPVVCVASDQCHDAGACDPSSGLCSNPARTNGAPCNDGNACTQLDTCQGGLCVGASPVACAAPDLCHDAGTCNPSTGACSTPGAGVSCVTWWPPVPTVSGIPGSTQTIALEFESTRDLQPVAVTAAGAPSWARLDADGLDSIAAAMRYRVVVDVAIPVGAAPGTYPQPIVIEDTTSGLSAASVSLFVQVTAPSAAAIPHEIALPSPDRVVFDELGTPVVRDELVVLLQQGLPDAAARIRDIAAGTGGVLIGAIPALDLFQLRYDLPDLAALATLRATVEGMVGVEVAPYHYLTAQDLATVPNDTCYASESWSESTPAGRNWALEAIRAPSAWDVETGTSAVVVGVIDTYLDGRHPDLAPNIAYEDPSRLTTTSSHGNHVAGTLCAAGDNGIGVSGVAWRCSLRLYDMAPVYLATTSGGTRSLYSAVGLAVKMYRAVEASARVVNISQGLAPKTGCSINRTPCEDPAAVRRVLRDVNPILLRPMLASPQTLWVFAAGNEGRDASLQSPASLATDPRVNAIAVAAVGYDQGHGMYQLESWSNYNVTTSTVEVAAPGGDSGGHAVLSTNAPGCRYQRTCGAVPACPIGDGRQYLERWGTSQAAPLVAGVAALILSKHPQYSPAKVKQCILRSASARESPIPGQDFGVVDAAAAVACPSSISGRVSGDVLAGVDVTVIGTVTRAAVTDANGNFTVTGLPNGPYIVRPSRAGYSFTPSSAQVTVADQDVSGVNFTASSVCVPSCAGKCGGVSNGCGGTCDGPCVAALGDPAVLSSTMPGGGNCWFTYPSHAVFTNASGTTWLATGEHHDCDTGVDRVVVYSRTAGSGTWTPSTPFSYAYSPTIYAWGMGMPGGLSIADVNGAPHILINNKRGWGVYSTGPSRGVYIRPNGASWTYTQDVTTDENLQIAEGNSSGAQYSGYNFSLVYDPAADLLRLFGSDGAWWATRYHAVSSTAAPGSATWSPLEGISTVTGAVDRGAIQSASQDLLAGEGVQAWVVPPSCAVAGRRLSGGSWGATFTLPLGFATCSSNSSDYWGIAMSSESLISQAGAPIIFVAGQSRVAGSAVTLKRIEPSGGSWSVTTRAMPSTWDSADEALWRAVESASGRLYILHVGPNRQDLMLYDWTADTDTLLRHTYGTMSWIDAERHAPAVLVWTESGGVALLEVADLTLP
jgi:hypothetical protein